MRKVKQSIIVPYSTKQMYELINDIDSYPQFLPWCKETKILSRDENEIKATIYIAKGFFNYSFTTQNLLTEYERIDMKLVEGPFKHLEGFWHFQKLEDDKCDKCKISFELEFIFSSNLFAITLDPIFQSILVKFVDAFKVRAEKIYG